MSSLPVEMSSSVTGTSPSTPSEMQEPVPASDAALSDGEIAGISIGVIAGVICLATIFHMCARKARHCRWYSAMSEVDLSNTESNHSPASTPPTIRSIEQMSSIPTAEISPPLPDPPQCGSIPPLSIDASSRGSRYARRSVTECQLSVTSSTMSESLAEDILALRTQLEWLDSQLQLQSTSAVSLQAQMLLLKAQLRSVLMRNATLQPIA